jgi:hypothetical protein
MADQLATPADLASLLQQDLDSSTATLLIECATAVVQQVSGGQRIVQVVGDSCSVLSTTDSWLSLPQIPVTTVTSVVLDGVTLTANTDYKVFGDKLWRRFGWQNNMGWSWGWDWNWRPSYADNGTPYTGQEPSLSVITYTHGYAAGSQDLQLARSAVLSLARSAYTNPSGVSSESIDDYHVSYNAMAAAMETTPFVKAALRKKYGRRAGLVRIG